MRLIQSLAYKELVRNLPKLKFDQHFCDACKMGKQAYASHKAKNIVSTTRCLELIHMDLFGSSAIRSYGGNRYTLFIVDDYSRYTWTRFLKDKTEASDQFEIFSRKIQSQLGCSIVSIRTNHGREFDNEMQSGEFYNANEPKNVNEALEDESWIVTMQEELNQFIANDVWELVAQGYNQQEGIDYDETYALVARLKSIKILLAYACALDFKLFQMDVKSAFLNGFINEEEIMPRKSSEDYKNTRHYIPKISHEFRTPIKEKLRNLEERYIHEGRVVFDTFTDLNYVRSLFHFVEFECLLQINEQVCPRFILEFYSQYRLSYSDEGQMFVEFVIQNQFFSYSLEEFAQILDIPCEGACVFTDRWSLDELVYGAPLEGPYQTNLPSPDDVISYIREDREGQVTRIRHQEEVEKFNLAYYMAKRMEWVTKQARLILPYGMLLTRLFKFIFDENPELQNESYVLYDRVMNPLAAQLERKPRKDRGTRRGRYSTSSSSAFDQPSSSHLNDDDDDDGNGEGTSRASTPSLIRYVNSLTNQVPQVFQNPPNIDPHLEPFYTRQIEIINRQVQL
ncbi:pentatricopeptide repeat-containing protein [Tanacetum coccineum]